MREVETQLGAIDAEIQDAIMACDPEALRKARAKQIAVMADLDIVKLMAEVDAEIDNALSA